MTYKKIALFILVYFTSFYLLQANNDEQTCLICFERLFDKQNDVITLACSGEDQKHEFHFKCLDEWQQNKFECAYCRSSLKSNSETTIRLYDNTIIRASEELDEIMNFHKKYTKNLVNILKTTCCGCFGVENIDE